MKSTFELLESLPEPIVLSSHQRSLVEHHGTPLIGDASAGSGKSTTSITKLLYMQRELNIPGHKIAFLMFNKEARDKAEEKYIYLCNELNVRPTAKFYTIHALCNFIVRKWMPDRSLVSEYEMMPTLRKLLSEVMERPTDKERKTVSELMSFMINRNLNIEQLSETSKFIASGMQISTVAHVYDGMMDHKKRNKLIDFDDMQLYALRLLENFPQVRDVCTALFDYWIIDEFQDVSPIQIAVVNQMLRDKDNFTAIGDGDQAIYRWRGADDKYINEFEKFFPNAQRIQLPINYRCPHNILMPAKRLIERNTPRVHKNIEAHKQGGVIRYCPSKSQLGSSQGIAQEIIELFNTKTAMPMDMAVLCRNNNQQMFVIDMLLQAGVPIRVASKENLVYNHFITSDLMNILEFATRQTDSRLFEKCAMKIMRGVNKRDIGNVARSMGATGQHWVDIIDRRTANEAHEMLNDVAHCLKNGGTVAQAIAIFKDAYFVYAKWMMTSLWDITETDLVDIFDYFSFLGERSFDDLKRYLARAKALLNSLDEEKNAVTIITMHICKGLEFKYVWLLHVSDEVLPNAKVMDKLKKILGDAAAGQHQKEETNLLYVAMTRAMEQLVITYPEDDISRLLYFTLEPGKSLQDVQEDVRMFLIDKGATING
ncbi:ATP-dependent helicase [Paenibacillus pabuli]|uniref:ATP-dependent helicase n=1 Tax=Paenibacillus pabuli TaxID=1472 RepID=UPI003242D271